MKLRDSMRSDTVRRDDGTCSPSHITTTVAKLLLLFDKLEILSRKSFLLRPSAIFPVHRLSIHIYKQIMLQ